MKIFDRFKKALAPRVEFLTNLSQPEHIPARGMDGHKLTNSGGCPVKQPQKEVTQMTKDSGAALRKELSRMNVSPEDREIYHQVIDSVVELERMYSAPKHIANQTVDEIREETSQLKIKLVKEAVKVGELMRENKEAEEKRQDDRANDEFFKVAGYKISGGR